MRQASCLGLTLALLAQAGPLRPQGVTDAEVARGIKQVEEGEYDTGIFTLDAAARRLAADPSRAGDCSRAYLYLGVAYLAKGHETAAKARFRDAILHKRDLTLSPDQFPPKVINLFEAAREDVLKAAPAAGKDGSRKGVIALGIVAAAGAGVALAAGGGGGSASTAPTTTTMTATTPTVFQGTLSAQLTERRFTVTAAAIGSLRAVLTWTNPNVILRVGLNDPPDRFVTQSVQSGPLSSVLTATVAAQPYVLVVNYEPRTPTMDATPFTLEVFLP